MPVGQEGGRKLSLMEMLTQKQQNKKEDEVTNVIT